MLISAGALVSLPELLPTGRPGPPPQPASSDWAEYAPAETGEQMRALPRAVPERIQISAIKVDAPVVRVGRGRDGELVVPPLSRAGEAGWYRNGPAPGQKGPAVIVGHVDSKSGPGVFYRLGGLKPGMDVRIVRSDGTAPVFRVRRIQRVPKKDFPTDGVYGPTNGPALRLITCGGRFDAARGHYTDNVIVYASPVIGRWPAGPLRRPSRVTPSDDVHRVTATGAPRG
jgi:sortase (surface protein transpeptidase)